MNDLVRRLEELRAKATPGPWTYDGCSLTNWHDHTFEMEWIVNGHERHGGTPINQSKDADGNLICELVNNLDTIIAALSAGEQMVMVPREADYALIERRFDTRDWEGEDYRHAQANYARWIVAAAPSASSTETEERS